MLRNSVDRAMPIANQKQGKMGKGAEIALSSLVVYLSPFAFSLFPAISATVSPTPIQPASPAKSPAQTLFDRGAEQYKANQFEAAIQTWQKVLQLYQQQNDAKGELSVLEAIGLAYRSLGNSKQAIVYYQKQLVIARKLGDRSAEANSLGNLGNSYRSLGDYGKAIESHQQGLRVRQEIKDRAGEGIVLSSLGTIYFNLGNYNKATEYLEQSLQIAKDVGNKIGVVLTLTTLGAISSAQEDYKQAIEYYEQSQIEAQKIGFFEAEGNALNNLGGIYHIKGDFQKAIDYYQKALAIAQKKQNLRLEAAANGGIGLGHVSLKEYAKALKFQEKSWQIAHQIGDRQLEASTLNNWGYSLWNLKKYKEAEQKFRASLEILESLRDNLGDSDKVSIFDTQIHAYNLLQQILVAQNQNEEALEIAERGRSRAFAELLSRRIASKDPTKAQAQNQLPAIKSPTIAQIKAIAKAQNATLVEYALMPDDSYLVQGKLKGTYHKLFIWVVKPSGEVAFKQVDLTTLEDSLVDTISDLRGAITSRNGEPISSKNPVRKAYPWLRTLDTLLIQPIAELLPTDPSARIIFIPQGELFLIPFPALLDASGKHLIEKHTILTAPAIQVLDLTRQVRQQVRLANLQDILIVGNPTMPSIGIPPIQLPNLPGAGTEAKAIATLFDTSFLTGDRATKAEVVKRMLSARIVHLATHGLLDEFKGSADIPGAIALAPDQSDRGLLTSSDILQLRLNVELVVLSACNTGRGLVTGDGVIGLSRSLITAGVPSVVVSLWSIPDAPTATLMTEFYQTLKSKPDKAQALRQAMLATKAKFPDPVNWAAFTLIGEAE
ncbi:CHAT domain-containing tetratricopeptide repeat protein [Tumidithrix elongata RA019]|uniref:CHAT domain-containing tetratricopeptide repeat protein n=1 Tax=Tumidithrix elongata BACA0141 TaxID=2716417 RepID=A0AAW9QBK3_9CYAN|nr:CHAT domain-containing tetratricopeptide repeat protein [Tumidithrix elongata RA019]